jgi:sec-independent protein translocase protein TatA
VPNIGPMEMIVVLAIALIVLGPRRLPELGRSLGSGMRKFKDSITGATPRPEELASSEARDTETA